MVLDGIKQLASIIFYVIVIVFFLATIGKVGCEIYEFANDLVFFNMAFSISLAALVVALVLNKGGDNEKLANMLNGYILFVAFNLILLISIYLKIVAVTWFLMLLILLIATHLILSARKIIIILFKRVEGNE